MFDQRFFASKVGLTALISVAAMASFNWYALSQPTATAATSPLMAVQIAELA